MRHPGAFSERDLCQSMFSVSPPLAMDRQVFFLLVPKLVSLQVLVLVVLVDAELVVTVVFTFLFSCCLREPPVEKRTRVQVRYFLTFWGQRCVAWSTDRTKCAAREGSLRRLSHRPSGRPVRGGRRRTRVSISPFFSALRGGSKEGGAGEDTIEG